jgi:hypothetical protein
VQKKLKYRLSKHPWAVYQLPYLCAELFAQGPPGTLPVSIYNPPSPHPPISVSCLKCKVLGDAIPSILVAWGSGLLCLWCVLTACTLQPVDWPLGLWWGAGSLNTCPFELYLVSVLHHQGERPEAKISSLSGPTGTWAFEPLVSLPSSNICSFGCSLWPGFLCWLCSWGQAPTPGPPGLLKLLSLGQVT